MLFLLSVKATARWLFPWQPIHFPATTDPACCSPIATWSTTVIHIRSRLVNSSLPPPAPLRLCSQPPTPGHSGPDCESVAAACDRTALRTHHPSRAGWGNFRRGSPSSILVNESVPRVACGHAAGRQAGSVGGSMHGGGLRVWGAASHALGYWQTDWGFTEGGRQAYQGGVDCGSPGSREQTTVNERPRGPKSFRRNVRGNRSRGASL
jgi:hypothetical protein